MIFIFEVFCTFVHVHNASYFSASVSSETKQCWSCIPDDSWSMLIKLHLCPFSVSLLLGPVFGSQCWVHTLFLSLFFTHILRRVVQHAMLGQTEKHLFHRTIWAQMRTCYSLANGKIENLCVKKAVVPSIILMSESFITLNPRVIDVALYSYYCLVWLGTDSRFQFGPSNEEALDWFILIWETCWRIPKVKFVSRQAPYSLLKYLLEQIFHIVHQNKKKNSVTNPITICLTRSSSQPEIFQAWKKCFSAIAFWTWSSYSFFVQKKPRRFHKNPYM